jgi:hypothetical protein
VPGSLGSARKTEETATPTTAATAATPRPTATRRRPPELLDATRRTNRGRSSSRPTGRCVAKSQTAARAAHGIRSRTKPVLNEREAASATRITLETTENARSRRRGTSNAWRTCTQTNSEASGARASSTVCAPPTRRRNAPSATNRPAASATFTPVFRACRRAYENQ